MKHKGLWKSIVVILAMCLLLCSCSGDKKSENVLNCEELISKIESVTLESAEDLLAAESAYDSLTEDEKATMTESAEKLANFRTEYDELVAAEEEAAKKAEQEAKAKAVVEQIDAIGTVTLESAEAIEAAKTAYSELDEEAKSLVSNYDVLEAADTELAELKSAEKEKLVEKYLSNFEEDADKVTGITWYFHDKMPEYIDTRSYIIPYIGVNENSVWICIRYNYTEDDWIFWEKLTIVTDNEKYTKTVGAFDTVRDNDNGVVWEWYDECLNYNQPLDSSELLMLKDIAESSETIIRFEGDEYIHDLTVTDTDKEIISDVLALYEGLLK